MKTKSYAIVTPKSQFVTLINTMINDPEIKHLLIQPTLLGQMIGGRNLYSRNDEEIKAKIVYLLSFINDYYNPEDQSSLSSELIRAMGFDSISDEWFDQWWKLEVVENYIDVDSLPTNLDGALLKRIDISRNNTLVGWLQALQKAL